MSSASASHTPLVHVITSLEAGGAQRALQRLLAGTDRARFPARVVSLVAGGPVAAELEREGFEVRDVGMRAGVPDPRAVWRLARLLKRWRPAVLQTWLYHADLVGLAAGRLARVPRILWNVRCSASPDFSPGFAARVAPRLCARLSRSPEAIVVNSERGRATHEEIGYRPRRWVHIPNGFDLERYRPDAEARGRLRAELSIAGDAVVAISVARRDGMKDHRTLVRAVRRARATVSNLVCLFVGGGMDAENTELAGWIAEEQPPGDAASAEVFFPLGERDDVPELLAASDVCVSSSLYEGFPNAVGEAMAVGLPVAATDVGDCAAIVGDAGRIVPPSDPEALGAAIAALAPAHVREELGPRARRRIDEHYSLARVIERYAELYAGGAPCAV